MATNSPTLPAAVNRRVILRQLAAGTALVSGGCELLQDDSEPDEAGETGTDPTNNPVANPLPQRRLFTVVLSKATGEATTPDKAALIADGQWQHLRSRIVENGGAATDVHDGGMRAGGIAQFQFTAWMKPALADEFAKRPEVVRVEPVKPGGPTDSKLPGLRAGLTPPPKEGHRQVVVVLGPNSWPTITNRRGFQSTEQIATLWNRQWKNVPDVTAQAVTAEKWAEINARAIHIGPVPGQVRVSFPGDEVPEAVLKTMLAHPQTLRIQWDHADVIYNCPPCGMG